MVDEVAKLQQQLKLYKYDYLTGLLQRIDFEHDLRVMFKSGTPFYLGFYDVNGLHSHNRLYGHASGDALIRSVASSIQILATPCNTYRLSGDEFVVLCTEPPTDYEVNDATAAFVYSGDFESSSQMVDAVDLLVTAKKESHGRRCTD